MLIYVMSFLYWFCFVAFLNSVVREFGFAFSVDCIVLKGWSLLPNALRSFQICCSSLNLGIRT